MHHQAAFLIQVWQLGAPDVQKNTREAVQNVWLLADKILIKLVLAVQDISHLSFCHTTAETIITFQEYGALKSNVVACSCLTAAQMKG